eukprot:m.12635 g.12635  ORF g.12635 m.12635 type:complete len:246 (+) comp4029_c0_seq1:26-763(+)
MMDEDGERSASRNEDATTTTSATVDTATSSSSSSSSVKKLTAKEKLALIRAKREKGREETRVEVAEEDRREKLPTNFEARKWRAEWKLDDDKKRKEAEEKGMDYDRVRAMTMTVEEAQVYSKKRGKRKQHENGFVSHAENSRRQYERLVHKLDKEGPSDRVDVNAEADLFDQTKKPRREAVDALVADVEEQLEKKKKWKKKRGIYGDGDVNYINEKNRQFNLKLERHYGKHTQEIKDSLERGTAL